MKFLERMEQREAVSDWFAKVESYFQLTRSIMFRLLLSFTEHQFHVRIYQIYGIRNIIFCVSKDMNNDIETH